MYEQSQIRKTDWSKTSKETGSSVYGVVPRAGFSLILESLVTPFQVEIHLQNVGYIDTGTTIRPPITQPVMIQF